ncbi:Uu.00g025340.m01.CDS01 [Anthostomella pinea]|uniref:Dehydrogenase FUB6 n=1 Tax=Anthostomella pinea TaxID=933095 RepID=A0AAI8YCE6_9PEZI|nr:Uu.00g025340.m01.CDS01 [Anthostomella pinea]
MVANKSLIFKKAPPSLPVPGEHLVVEERPFDLQAVPSGGLIVEVLSVSLDPYLRHSLRDPEDDKTPSYMTPFELNEPLYNSTIARVLKSDSKQYAEGDLLYVTAPFAQYAAISSDKLPSATKLDNPDNLSPDYFLGPLGMPGLTAYSSLYQIGRPKEGETIFVSSAAGAVGSMVGQLAKVEGLTVIGSVGSDEKLDYILNELGFDGGFNYKKEAPVDALARLAPEGIHIYYENVGGAHLEAAIQHLNTFGRIVVSGMIEGYNKPLEERYGVRNLVEFFGKRLSMHGFLVADPDFGPKYTKEHQKNVQKWISEGSLKAKLHVTHGLDHAAGGFSQLFQGKNFGKAVLKIKE